MLTGYGSLLTEFLDVIRSYLLFGQRRLRENLASGMFRLGFDADVAETIIKRSPAQVIRLASSSSVLCVFRLNDGELLANLTHDVLGGVLQQAHLTILLAQRDTVVA